jgi:hypothetical protein
VKRAITAVIAMIGVLAIAGCTFYPKGVDGNLTNNWGKLPAPRQVVPHAGACYSTPDVALDEVPVLPCSASHLIEFFKVGTFTGDVADKPIPPFVGSGSYLDEYDVCDRAATAFLGKDWHDGLLALSLEVPDPLGWKGGARWYACALSATSDLDGSDPVFRTGSLQHALSTSGSLTITCVDWTNHGNDFVGAHTGSCSKSHSGELAGIFTVPASKYPTTAQWHTYGDEGCEPVVAKFLGFTDGVDHNASIGYSWTYVSKDQWVTGDRTARCYASAYAHNRKMIGSVKGIRSRAPKD